MFQINKAGFFMVLLNQAEMLSSLIALHMPVILNSPRLRFSVQVYQDFHACQGDPGSSPG